MLPLAPAGRGVLRAALGLLGAALGLLGAALGAALGQSCLGQGRLPGRCVVAVASV